VGGVYSTNGETKIQIKVSFGNLVAGNTMENKKSVGGYC
jgi:hypothetical protein